MGFGGIPLIPGLPNLQILEFLRQGSGIGQVQARDLRFP